MEQFIIDFFHKVWGTFKDGKSPPIFPGPQPISIEKRHFPILKNGRYVICEKTDGVRHALVCTMYEGKKVAFLINRALQLTPVKLSFPKRAYDGTVVDGELVDGSLFMVYDGVMIYGENLMPLNFIDRLGKTDMFTKGIMRVKKDKIQVKIKTFFPTSEIHTFFNDYFPTLPYKTDGLVFTPVDDPIRIGTHETMFKWKPRDLNTIDFQVKRRGETSWGLYIQERGVLIFQSQIEGPESEWMKEDNILECQYMLDETPVWWKPVGIRTDKHHPNNRRTYYRTMVNVREDIKVDEFKKMFR
jgi:hypothetical protein